MKNLVISTLVLMLAGATFATTFYENNFSTDPFTDAIPWTKTVTGASSASWSSGAQALWIYSPDKTSQANAYSPTISGQGTEYQVTIQFMPQYTGTSSAPTSDNMVYLFEPLTTANSNRDICIALAYTGGTKNPRLAIRSTVGANVWAWSYQDAIFPIATGTSYELKYERTEGSTIIQAWVRLAGDTTWTALKDSLGNDFTLIGGVAASSTFDKIHVGLANNASMYQAYLQGVSITSVPEPATMTLVCLGASLLAFRKRK